MKRRILGKTGLEVSVVGFGGIPIQGLDATGARDVLCAALDLGINFIDTARGYSDSEEKIGRALHGRRDEYILATKSMARTAAAMEEELVTSLRNLRTDVIDVYQLHAVGSDEQLAQVLGSGGALETLRRAQQAGAVRFIGVTGHARGVLKKAVDTGLFDTVQLPFNPLETEWLGDVIPAARQRGLGIIGMKPVAGGALINVPAALRYALERGPDVVIPGMDSIAQVEENAEVGLEFRPPSAEEISGLDKEKENWQGHFCRRCGYCKPCPEGLEIPFLLLIEAYYTRYNLRDWSLERLAGLKKHYRDCTACGVCEARCPYELPISELMKRADEKVR